MKKKSGFTLIEVLVSVVILSAGIVFVLHAFETAAVALSEVRDTIWAGTAAQNEVERLRVMGAAGEDIASGYWSGRYRTYYSDFLWERRVSDAGPAGGEEGIKSVFLLVSREGSRRQYKYETHIRVAARASGGESP